MIEYKVEELKTMEHDMKELLEKHYKELTLNKEVMKLEPDWTSYYIMEAHKGYVLVSAREDGKLVGYSGFFIMNHLHYKSTKIAQNDVLFLDDDYRNGTTGIKLIKACERFMKELGVVKMFWHIKEANDFRPIMKRLGYSSEEYVVSKII